jgi:hypothetical protein
MLDVRPEPDPDPGGPKTYRYPYYGCGSTTLVEQNNFFALPTKHETTLCHLLFCGIFRIRTHQTRKIGRERSVNFSAGRFFYIKITVKLTTYK